MAFNGLFIIQLGNLSNPPKDIDVVALPFKNCPDGMLGGGTIVNVGLKDNEIEKLELTVFGKPIYYEGWEIITEISNSGILQTVYDYLMLPENGKVDDRRLIALESFAFV